MSAAAPPTSKLANSPASGGGFDRPQVAIIIGLEWRLPPARAFPHGGDEVADGLEVYGEADVCWPALRLEARHPQDPRRPSPGSQTSLFAHCSFPVRAAVPTPVGSPVRVSLASPSPYDAVSNVTAPDNWPHGRGCGRSSSPSSASRTARASSARRYGLLRRRNGHLAML
jgi:hypothetical protein